MIVKRNFRNKNNPKNQVSANQAKPFSVLSDKSLSPTAQKESVYTGSQFSIFGMEEEGLEKEETPEEQMEQLDMSTKVSQDYMHEEKA